VNNSVVKFGTSTVFNHHLCVVPEISHYFKVQLLSLSCSPPTPESLVNTDLHLALWIDLFGVFHSNAITGYVTFCVWLLSCRIVLQVSSMLQHMLVFHFFCGWIILHSVYIPNFVYPSIDWWALGFFFLVLMNAAMNMCVQIFVWVSTFSPLEYILRSAIAGHMIILFSFLGTTTLFSIEAGPFYILANTGRGLPFFNIFTNNYFPYF
jgi:hypothetical protein